jgi:hypothetical protein
MLMRKWPSFLQPILDVSEKIKKLQCVPLNGIMDKGINYLMYQIHPNCGLIESQED